MAPLAACIYRLLKLEGCCLNRTLSFSLLFPFFFLPFSLFVCCVVFFFHLLIRTDLPFSSALGSFQQLMPQRLARSTRAACAAGLDLT